MASVVNHQDDSVATASSSAWPALVVNKVNEKSLFDGMIQGSALPTCIINFPLEDTSKIAVLSWRWDGLPAQHPFHGSKNIFVAIRQAKKLGIEFLFIDVISIDQMLQGDALLREIVSFSSLYQTIPVIAAYDMPNVPLFKTSRRPWIASELCLCRNNPTRLIYVTWGMQRLRSHLIGEKDLDAVFETFFKDMCNYGFTFTINGLLHGDFQMTSISDLKYIIPSLAPILAAAYEKMDRNDYLLSAAILCKIGEPNCFGMIYPNAIRCMSFQRYKLRGNQLVAELLLDNKLIAVYKQEEKWLNPSPWESLIPVVDAKSTIISALGLPHALVDDFQEPTLPRDSQEVVDETLESPRYRVEGYYVQVPRRLWGIEVPHFLLRMLRITIPRAGTIA